MHALRSLLIAFILLLCAVTQSAAATYNLPADMGVSGKPFVNCVLTSGTLYTCTGSVSTSNNDTVNFTSSLTLYATTNITFQTGATLNGNGYQMLIKAASNIVFGNALTSTASISYQAGSNITVGNNPSISGDLTAGANITIGNNATINGNISSGNALQVGSNFVVTGTCIYVTTNFTCTNGTNLTKRASAPSVAVGSNVTYTITATSGTAGPLLPFFIVYDNVPAGLSYVSCVAPAGGGCGIAFGTPWMTPCAFVLFISFCDLAAGDTMTGSFTFQATAAGSITNTATSYTLFTPVDTATSTITATGGVSVDHYELGLNSNSVACVASTVTVKACANSSSPCTSVATSFNGTASLATTAGTLGASSVSFSAGVASTTLSYASAPNNTAVTVTLSGESTAATNARQCYNGSTAGVSNSCATTFNTAGLFFASAADGASANIATQTAGTTSSTYYLRAVKTNTTTKACEAALSGTTAVDWGYECNNPGTCSASNLMTISGASSATISKNNNASVIGYTSMNLAFDANGNAPFTLNYADAGQVTLWARKLAGGSLLTNLAGSSSAFVVRPATLKISGASSGLAASNPGTTTTAGSVFAAAGDAFTVNVVGYTSTNAVTPNFGNETTLPTLSLNNLSVVAPATGPASGTLTTGSSTRANSAGLFNGTASITGNNWSEVGAITLRPDVADYLGTGAVTGTQSGTIGRFRPYQYGVSGTLSVCSSPTFVYAGQPLAGTLTITAQNKNGGTTTNYGKGTSSLATLAANQLTFGNVTAGLAVDTASSLYSLAFVSNKDFNSLANGTAQIAAAVPVKMSAVPSNPITSGLALSAMTDEVATVAGAPTSLLSTGTTSFWLGRLRALSAYGSELLPLRVPVRAEYYNAGAWTVNTSDTCTTFPVAAVALGDRNPSTMGSSVTSVVGMSATSPGVATIILAKPTVPGVLDLALDLGSGASTLSAASVCLSSWSNGPNSTPGAGMAYLAGAWCGTTYSKMPLARVKFGSPKSSFIYLRERY